MVNRPHVAPSSGRRHGALPALPRLAASVVWGAMLLAGGCNVIGWMAQGLHGDKAQKTTVTAQYRGLDGSTVAVLVSASPHTGSRYPYAAPAVTQAVSARLLREVEAVEVVDPRELERFHRENPYWNTLPYSELARRLRVDRVVHIDLSRYETHEPGNAYQWQGVILANVGVAEAESNDPASFAFFTMVEARYPSDQRVGVINANDATIQLGMVTAFSRQVVNLFRDYEVEGR